MMKFSKLFFLIFSVSLVIFLNSCDDTGNIVTSNSSAGEIYFSTINSSGSNPYGIYSSSSEGINQHFVSNLGLLTSKCYNNKMIIGRIDSGTYYNNIYAVNLDGTGAIEIPRNNYFPVYISLSPDANKILFGCDVGNYLCVVNTDGTGLMQVSQNLYGAEASPVFSPNGNRIAFLETIPFVNTYLTLINTNGTNSSRLKDSIHHQYNSTICWSPDGNKLAFDNTNYLGKRSIFIINSDGTGYFNLTNSSHIDDSPDWSPDGTKIVYSTYETSGIPDIAVINSDGTGKANLTFTSNVYEYFPKWSPDGKKILYHTASETSLKVFDVNTGVTVLISDSTTIGFWNYTR